MSAEDSEIMSITNSAIESLNKSDSFRSLVGDDFRQFLILPLGGNTFYLKLLSKNVLCNISICILKCQGNFTPNYHAKTMKR